MNIVQIQNRVQELPNSQQTMQYLNAAMNGQVATVPPYIAAAELKRRETEGMMDQLAKGAAQAQQPTVKDQLAQKAGIMALMGQAQPPQRPQIPQPGQPQAQPQAEGGIDQLPVKDDMFGMAGGGIVAFNGEGRSDVPAPYETPYDRMNRQNREADKPLDATAQAALQDAQRTGDRNAMLMTLKKLGAAGYDVATLIPRALMGVTEDVANTRLGRALGVDFKLPEAAYGGDRASMTPMMDRVKRAEGAAPRQAAPQSAAASPSVLNAPSAVEMTGTPAPSNARPPAPPPGQRPPPAAAKPAAQGAPAEGIKSLLAQVEAGPAYKRLMEGVSAQNPYAGSQESQADYIKRMTEGIKGQLPGGKMPWETSEERLKGIEARRAREDADYKASTTGEGRRMDNLITMLTNMGAGSFGQGGSQGVRAVQALERSQREEALKRQDMRDQQDQKMAEIRSLNDQAQMALATGNVQAYEKLTQEAKKLRAEFDKDQATLAKGAAEITSKAGKEDLEAKIARERMAKDLQVANTYAAARGDRGAMTEAQIANIRAKAIKDVEAALSKDFRKRQEIAANPALKDQMVQERIKFILQQGYTEGEPSPAPAAGGTRPPLSSFQR